jgi:hypothetical protein
MWAEVKALDPPMSQELIGSAYTELKRRLSQFSGSYRIDASISSAFNQGSAKKAERLLSSETKMGSVAEGVWYIAVPVEDVENQHVALKWIDRNGIAVRMASWKSRSGIYACPLEAQPGDWTADIQFGDGLSRTTIPAYKVLTIQIPPAVMLRVEADAAGRGLSSVSTAEAQTNTTVERLRRVIDDASDQIRNGQAYRSVPGIVNIFFDHLGGGGEDDILRACLGDLTIPIDVATRSAGEVFYGPNGILRPTKNSAVSAITYRSRFYPTVSFINPWATYAISRRWVDGTIYWIDGGCLKRQ